MTSRDVRTNESPNPQEVHQLVALFNDARYAEAEILARAMTKDFPRCALGWKAWAIVLTKLGRSAEALAAAKMAVELLPNDAEVHSNLGKIQKDLGQLTEAVKCCRRAIELKPDFAEAHNDLCAALHGLGRLTEAEVSARKVLEINPNSAQSHTNLGAILTGLGRLAEAVSSFRRAAELRPDLVEPHSNLGATLRELGQLDEAVANCRRALEINPNYAKAHNNLGGALLDLGRFEEAAASYQRAIGIYTDYAETSRNLSNNRQGDHIKGAAESDDRALEFKSDLAQAHNNLGNALTNLGRFNEAESSYRRALEIKPDYTEAYSNLLFLCSYQPRHAAVKMLDEARRFGDLVARRARPYTNWPNVPKVDRCLRVGLVSGDLRSHPVGYFLGGILTNAARGLRQLEFFAYPTYPRSDGVTELIKNCCRGWHSAVGLSDEVFARRVREDGIDILIDLAGHTAHNRLPMFAWNPAPVQATWLGYLGTTGVAAMDYLIADQWCLPESEAQNFTEHIWRLPDSYLCFTPPHNDLPVFASPAVSTGYPTFGCFNNLAKVNDSVVTLWARILQAVPRSRLFLKAKRLSQRSSQDEVMARFAEHGIDPERLILEGPALRRADMLASYRRVDIALDPFPYPGITTTVEALWMGVPVLTMNAESYLSRQGVGLLMNLELPDWIAADQEDYVARAVMHSANIDALTKLRSELRRRLIESPLCDAPRFARNLENALRSMWTHWCQQRR